MKKILILSVTALKEKLFINFMLIVLNIIDMFEDLSQKFNEYVDDFRAAYDEMNEVYLKYDLKYYTQQVQDRDEERVTAFRKMRDKIRYAMTYPENDEQKQAAEILMEIIDLYGCSVISRLKAGEKNTALVNLIEDYEQKYTTQIEALGLTAMLAELRKAQDKYMQIYLLRTEVDAEIGLKTMADARARMTEAYRDLVTAVNLAAKRDTHGELTEFIDMMNVEIRKNFVHTGQSASSAGDSNGSLETDEDGVKYVNITYYFANGNVQGFRLESGTPLVPLENTPGYKWDKKVPELVPRRSLVLREVPIEAEEGTAVFHFLDHSEETLRQVVGTELIAPENTDGCHWDPEVPATMPAGDTQYYEVLDTPDEEEGGEGGGSGSTGGGSGTGGNGGSTGGGVIYPGEPGEDTDL